MKVVKYLRIMLHGLRQCGAVLLSVLLAASSSGSRLSGAQAAAAGPKLQIVIVEGEGAINNIKQRTAREMVVRVEDENHRPVAGAAVAFTLPARGAGGLFPHGSRLLTVMADQNGRAAAAMKPNHVLGAFRVNVTASLQGQTATATITQTNVLASAAAAAGAAGGAAAGGAAAGGAAGISTGVLAGIIAGAAAVAAGVGVAVTRGGGGSSAKPTATIGAGGPVTVGPPH